jgi:hypothetical protein
MRNLNDNEKYHIKLIRLYEPWADTQWEGNCQLHIQTRPNGDIGVLTPKPDQIPIPWAEYCHEDINEQSLNGHIHCVCEDYLMIIT